MNRFAYIVKPAFFVSCFFVFFLVVIEIVAANSMVTLGKEVKSINDKLDVVLYENEALEKKIASASSIASIEVRAREFGFAERIKTVHIGQQSLTAKLPGIR
ncbi:hypothetical protein HY947_02770 [Candidatus Gottesmanbacteria bacterium]|nr:hypothetical protein [Candidatus Gottesmanbacteria bacterium]